LPGRSPLDSSNDSTLILIVQILRVVTNIEWHRAIVIGMFHPLSLLARKQHVKLALTHKPLASTLLRIGRIGANAKSSSNLSVLDSNHPQLSRKKEEQIAELATRLRSVSGAGDRLSVFATGFDTPLDSADRSSPRADSFDALSAVQCIREGALSDSNWIREGFERVLTGAYFGDDGSGESMEKTPEELQCSLLSCLVLHKLCSSVLSLTERSRYENAESADITPEAGPVRVATPSERSPSAAYVYAHLLQTMNLWPALSATGALHPPLAKYWAINDPIQAIDSSSRVGLLEVTDIALTPVAVPSVDDLEFEPSGHDAANIISGGNVSGDSPVASATAIDIEDSMIQGIKLDMKEIEPVRSIPADVNAKVCIPQPMDFDVTLELAYSAADVFPNPFSTEPGVSITARRRSLDFAENAVVAQRVNNSVPLRESPSAGMSTDSLLKALHDAEWIDPDIVPVPVLDTIWMQQFKEKTRWSLGAAPQTIPRLLADLVASRLANKSLPIMQVYLH
jgi:hypothetical protein